VSGFRVGVIDQIFNSRVSPTAAMRANYLGAVAAGADSFWVGDHVSSVFARSIATSQHMGAARLVRFTDSVAALHSAVCSDGDDSAGRAAHMSVADRAGPMSLQTAAPLYERSNWSR
jgi:hypothetical protein